MKTLVIDRASMGMGGIESNYANVMKHAVLMGYRVVWLTTRAYEETSAFKEITDDSRVEKRYVKRTPFGPFYPKTSWAPEDEVTVLSSDLLRYLVSNPTLSRSLCKRFSHVLTVPHFKGFAVFPEKCFDEGRARRYWHRKMAVAAEYLSNNDLLVGFSQVHLDTYEKNYGVSINGKEHKLIPPVFSLAKPSEEEVAVRASSRDDGFSIITCTRFDFPHKGYVLGLIRAFAGIHESYPQTRLIVVGYGDGQAQIDEAVGSLPAEAREAVELTGPLSQEQLKDRMQRCHVNVGVAGSLLRGAECALPSIVMRHYTENFEGYGLFEDVGKRMSDEPGEDMTAVLERLIVCPDEEYIARSFASFARVDAISAANPEFLFCRGAAGMEQPPVSALSARALFFLRFCFERLVHRSPFEDRDNG